MNKVGGHFPLEFKIEAVKLVTEQGYTQSKAGEALGISSKNISRWLKELSNPIPSKKKGLTSEQQELVKLRKENQPLRMERAILKKAAAFFANESN
ncbi:MAG: transposase [Candidatus Symbiodolus clandestinus]